MRQLSQALGVNLFQATSFLSAKGQFTPRISQECEIEWDLAETRPRPSYLEEVRDIRMDLVNHANAIIEDGSCLMGMQSSLNQ
jgi:hypothetical protein